MDNNGLSSVTIETASYAIKQAFLQGWLPKLIGEAIGKHAVLMQLIGAPGDVLILGSCKSDSPNRELNQLMIRQIAERIFPHLKDMQTTAVRNKGKESGIDDIHVQVPETSECDECHFHIPNTPGGSLANKFHSSSCSLYDEQEN